MTTTCGSSWTVAGLPVAGGASVSAAVDTAARAGVVSNKRNPDSRSCALFCRTNHPFR